MDKNVILPSILCAAKRKIYFFGAIGFKKVYSTTVHAVAFTPQPTLRAALRGIGSIVQPLVRGISIHQNF
jgi:hypothetical protein